MDFYAAASIDGPQIVNDLVVVRYCLCLDVGIGITRAIAVLEFISLNCVACALEINSSSVNSVESISFYFND